MRKVEFLAAGEACKAAFRPTPDLKERTLVSCGFAAEGGPSFLRPLYPTAGRKGNFGARYEVIKYGRETRRGFGLLSMFQSVS